MAAPATSAEITPGAICLDTANNLYIADYSTGEARIATVNRSTHYMTTFAGTDTGYIYNGDGISATSANIAPNGLAFDRFNNLYVSDGYNNRIRKIDAMNVIHTVAGTGIAGDGGDGGPATAAEFNQPEGIAFDICGSLNIADINNARVRRLNLPPILTIPTISPPTRCCKRTGGQPGNDNGHHSTRRQQLPDSVDEPRYGVYHHHSAVGHLYQGAGHRHHNGQGSIHRHLRLLRQHNLCALCGQR